MTLIHGIFFGIGMLILAFLALSNAGGVATIFKAVAGGTKGNVGVVDVIKTLQGN